MKAESFKYIVFLVLLFVMISAAILVVSNINAMLENILWVAAVGLFIILAWKSDVILMLEDYQRAVIMRFGRVRRVGGPGWCLLVPFIEKPTIVDLRTQTLDVPKQEVITKGKIELGIDTVIYLHVGKDKESVIKSVIEVENYKEASRLYVISALRDVLGSMTLDDVITNIDLFFL